MNTKLRLPTIEELISSEKKKPVTSLKKFKELNQIKKITDEVINEAVAVAQTVDRAYFKRHPKEVFYLRPIIIGESETDHPCNAMLSVSVFAKARCRFPLALPSETVTVAALMDFAIGSLKKQPMHLNAFKKCIKRLKTYKKKHGTKCIPCSSFSPFTYQEAIEALNLKNIRGSEGTIFSNKDLCMWLGTQKEEE